MRWTLALSTLSLLACTDAPRSLLTDLPVVMELPDLAVPSDLAVDTIAITMVSPAVVSTVGRDLVTINGSGFDNRTSFLIGGQPAEIFNLNPTTAIVYAPPSQTWGVPVSIQAIRGQDGARANNSNMAMSASRFSYYASTPTFQQISRFNNAGFTNVRVPLVGDFNGDNKADFFYTANNTGSHQTYINTGGANFTLTELTGNPPSNLGVLKGTVIDLNGDTFQDVLVNDDGATWAYMMGNGQGLFTTAPAAPQNSYANNCSVAQSPTPIKLSSATVFDVAVACQNQNTVRIWVSAAGANVNSFYGGQNTASQGPVLAGFTTPVHLQVVDVNKDTYNDLVVLAAANNQPTLYWFNSPAAAPPVVMPTTPTGNSGLAGTPGANQLNQNPFWMKCADLNNDQYPDCVVADLNTSTIRVFMNQAGTFMPPVANGIVSVAQEPREVNLVDMNGDGKLDLLVANRAFNSFEVIPGRGDGTFGTVVSMDGRVLASRSATIVPDCLRTWSVQVADFDGDGLRDVMTTCEANAAGGTTVGGVVLFRNVSR